MTNDGRPAARRLRRCLLLAPTLLITACSSTPRGSAQAQPPAASPTAPGTVLTGRAALGDWTTDAPGVRRRITPADMPAPYATRSVDNGPRMVRRPEGATPQVPQGFRVQELVSGLRNPRKIITAPN